jgi:hypothetical protein
LAEVGVGGKKPNGTWALCQLSDETRVAYANRLPDVARGMAGVMGMAAGAWMPPQPPPGKASKPTEEELSELKGLTQALKQQLDQITKRIEDLEKNE